MKGRALIIPRHLRPSLSLSLNYFQRALSRVNPSAEIYCAAAMSLPDRQLSPEKATHGRSSDGDNTEGPKKRRRQRPRHSCDGECVLAASRRLLITRAESLAECRRLKMKCDRQGQPSVSCRNGLAGHQCSRIRCSALRQLHQASSSRLLYVAFRAAVGPAAV